MKKILLKISYILSAVFIIFILPFVSFKIVRYLLYAKYNLWYKCGTGVEIQFCRDQWDFWLIDAIDNKYLQLAVIIILYLIALATVSYVPARIFFKTKKGVLPFVIITSILSIGLFVGLILLSIAVNNS